ncbi:MAG: histidinol-phosphatase [Bacteroidales bacterium]|nr:histidinol-phosphatase [Bacteroidales bacterium]
MKCNYHTHSTYCDGKDPFFRFVEEAVRQHFDQLGFSSHAPVSFENDFGIKEEQISEYVADIQKLKVQYPEVQLFTALECDFIPGITRPFSDLQQQYHLDYIIGGVHLVKPQNSRQLWFIDGSKIEIYDNGLADLFHHDIKKAVSAFWEQTFEMIETQHFDIIAHLDKIKMHNQKRFFTESEDWYLRLVDHSLELIKQKALIIEINSRGIYKKRCPDFYPSDYILQEISKLKIPMVISSDAHQSEELSMCYEATIQKLRSFDIYQLMYLKQGKWEEYSI